MTEVNTLNRYAHAKLLYLSGDNNLFISGSANFSEPAWSQNITSGKASNAEAIIVVSGNEAKVLAESLSIANVTNLDTVIRNSERKVKRNTESQSSCDLVIIEAQGNSEIHIPAMERWGVEHRLCYKNDLDLFESIDSKFHEGSWIIERAIVEQNKGRVINVVLQDTVIALIVLIFSDQIVNKCTSPKERLLTEAIGSLGTDMPNLSGLLKCFEGMVFTSSESSAQTSKKIENNSHEVDPETLIESFSNSIARVGMSGRHRAVGGDIGLLLDCFIYNIGRRGGIDSTKIFGEDELGRNEEDLIGSEDTAVDYLVEVDISSQKVIDENFQKKMLVLLKRLDTYISSLTNRSKIIENIPVVLSILVLSYTLYQYQKKRKLISKEYLEGLNELIFVRVLSESDPLSINEALIDEFYTSDEWTQFVAYLTWLAYVCGISFRPPLPVSATIQARDSAIWSNACWLYLAQRLHDDSATQSLASEYTLAVNEDASIWLTNVISSGKLLSTGETAKITNRYSFAQSPAGAFRGFKLVTEVNSQYVKLGGINSKHSLGVFAVGHLSIIPAATHHSTSAQSHF